MDSFSVFAGLFQVLVPIIFILVIFVIPIALNKSTFNVFRQSFAEASGFRPTREFLVHGPLGGVVGLWVDYDRKAFAVREHRRSKSPRIYPFDALVSIGGMDEDVSHQSRSRGIAVGYGPVAVGLGGGNTKTYGRQLSVRLVVKSGYGTDSISVVAVSRGSGTTNSRAYRRMLEEMRVVEDNLLYILNEQ